MAIEPRRGCGYRKIGGLYMCSGGLAEPCHRLPIPLEVCPTCHHGIKQTRGWTWVKPDLLGGNCARFQESHCINCVCCTPELMGERAGLLWIGERFYKTAADFSEEANRLGVSRRITAIPKGFEPGSFVLLAHPKAVVVGTEQDDAALAPRAIMGAGIFRVFRADRIEKILADNETKEEIDKWEKKGCRVILFPHDDKDHKGTVYDEDEENGDMQLI